MTREDAVSRKKLELLLKFYDVHSACFTVDNLRNDIDKLPSVIHEKKANWVKYNDKSNLWQCSNCGTVIYSEHIDDLNEFHAWCGKCGAEMREDNE